MLLTDADRKERIARIQQSIAELSALTTERQKVRSYQTYRQPRAITITITASIKLSSAHKLSVGLWPSLSLCIVMGDDLPFRTPAPRLTRYKALVDSKEH
jgi:hypothetical protein